MPYVSKNGILLGPYYTDATTLLWSYSGSTAGRVTGYVTGTDAVMQILEEPPGQGTFPPDAPAAEILLRAGFNTRELPPCYGVRFRVWDLTTLGAAGTADMTLLG